MSKDYIVFNEEPNTNILGLDPLIHALCGEEMEKFASMSLSVLPFELTKGKFKAIALTKELADFSSLLLERLIKDQKFENAMVENIKDRADKIYKLCKKTLRKLKNSKIKEEERKKIIQKIHNLYISINAYGLLGPIIELSSGGLSNKLNTVFKNKTKDLAKLNEYISLLTYRFKENYDQKGQAELAEIAEKVYQNQNLRDLFAKESSQIKTGLPANIKKEIDNYIFEWGWLGYSYCGPEYIIDKAINDIKGMIALDISPREQINRFKKELKNNQQKQKKLIKETNFANQERYLIEVAQNFSETKLLRAKMIFLASFTINNLLKYFANKEGLSLRQLGVCSIREIYKYFKGESLPLVDVLNKRLDYCLLISRRNDEEILLGDEAHQWFEKNVVVEEIDENISEIFGQVAYQGPKNIIQGKVKLVNVAEDMAKFESGDILVSIGTTPEIVPAMKKAAAIVSDLGGLTCHAAIISRELGVPCIIGTKIATKVLKDGDRVAVDITKGTVRKL